MKQLKPAPITAGVRKGIIAMTSLTLMTTTSLWAQDADDEASEGSGRMLEEVVVQAQRREQGQQEVPSSLVAFDASSLEQISAENFKDISFFVPNLTIGGATPFGEAVPLYSIRGVSSASGRVSAEPAVAVYYDGLYLPRAIGSLQKLVDIESVSILRGPQGTLFGRNATVGAIQYLIKPPENEFAASATANVGTSSRFDLVGMLNVPMGERAAFRLNAATWNRDGYIDVVDQDGNLVADSGETDEQAFRGAFRFEPTDRLTIDLAATYAESTGIAPSSIINDFSVRQGPGGINAINPGDPIPFDDDSLAPAIRGYQIALDNLGLPPLVAQDPRMIYGEDGTRIFSCYLDQVTPVEGDYITPNELCTLNDEIENTIFSARVDYELNDQWSLGYTGGYINGDYNIRNIVFGNLYNRTNVTEVDSYSHELILKFSSERTNGLIGAFYFNEQPFEHTGDRAHVRFGPPFLQGNVEATEEFVDAEVDSWALFADVTFDVTDRFSISAGVRYSEDDKKTTIGFYDVTNGGADEVPIAEDYPGANVDWDGDGVNLIFEDGFSGEIVTNNGFDAFTDSASFDSTDWRLSGRYFVQDDKMVYLTVATGYKGGGFSDNLVTHVPTPDCGPGPASSNCIPYDSPVRPYDPEEVIAYELGFKGDWLDGNLRTNIAAFAMDYTDFQVQFATFNQPRFGSPALVMFNAGDVMITGLEGDLQWLLGDYFILSASFGTTDYDWDRLDPLSELYFLDQCPDIEFEDVNVDNCPIRDVKQAPDYSYTLGLDFRHDFWIGEIKANINYGYTDDYEASNGDNSFRIDGFGITNLRVEFDAGASGQNWSVALHGTNIFDEDYVLYGLVLDGRSPTYTSTYIPGRGSEYWLSMKYRF